MKLFFSELLVGGLEEFLNFSQFLLFSFDTKTIEACFLRFPGFVSLFTFSKVFFFFHLYCNCLTQFWFHSRQFLLSLGELTSHFEISQGSKCSGLFRLFFPWTPQLISYWFWQKHTQFQLLFSHDKTIVWVRYTFWGSHFLTFVRHHFAFLCFIPHWSC